MEAIKFCLAFLLLVLYSAENGAATSCRPSCQTIKDAQPGSPSGPYLMQSNSGIPFQVYCEMGLGGGGYTFLPTNALSYLKNDEISSMFTNRTSFLLRARLTNGTQPYAVLKQLSEYSAIPLMLSMNDYTGYNAPVNTATIGQPYLYFGFLPIANASNNNLQGLEVNGRRITFSNCDRNPNSQMTLFANFREVRPSNSYIPGSVCDQIFSNLKANPSDRVMPTDYFTFAETYWGGCGCYTDTKHIPGVISLSIGFR